MCVHEGCVANPNARKRMSVSAKSPPSPAAPAGGVPAIPSQKLTVVEANAMNDDEKRIKHLEMIQAVVTRLAGNSFSMKGWCITLVTALIALSAKDANWRYAGLALLPAIFFWGLDAYYLRQERLFRKLFDAVRTENKLRYFGMNTSNVADLVASWPRVLVSRTLIGFYLPVLLAVGAIIVYAVRHQPAPQTTTPASIVSRQ